MSEQPHRVLHILLVEDDDDHADLIRRALRSGDANVLIERVSDGAEAIEYVRRRTPYTEAPRPDLMLLDIKLPKLDGHEVLAEIKQDDELCTIPIVVLTTSQAASDRIRAYELHANSYLVKPLDFEHLHEMLTDLRKYWIQWNEPACVETASA